MKVSRVKIDLNCYEDFPNKFNGRVFIDDLEIHAVRDVIVKLDVNGINVVTLTLAPSSIDITPNIKTRYKE